MTFTLNEAPTFTEGKATTFTEGKANDPQKELLANNQQTISKQLANY